MPHGQDETILPALAMGGARGGISGAGSHIGRPPAMNTFRSPFFDIQHPKQTVEYLFRNSHLCCALSLPLQTRQNVDNLIYEQFKILGQ